MFNQIFQTTAGDIKFVSLKDFLDKHVSISKSYQTVQTFNRSSQPLSPQKSLLFNALESTRFETYFFFEVLAKLKICKSYEDMQTYTRQSVQVVEFNEANMEQQLIDGIINLSNNPVAVLKGKVLDELVEQAAHDCISNFGTPDYLVSLSNNRFAVISSNASSIGLKMVSAHMGALIVYTPSMHRLIELEL